MNHPYAEFIQEVEKPSRYLGGEFQSQVKDWSTVDVRFCLAFPDVYDIGMSHLGQVAAKQSAIGHGGLLRE